MFDSLVDKMNAAFKKFRSKGKLTEADVREGMREIKLALLEADVNFKVVRDFIKRVTERAVGADVLESLMPGQQIMGGTQSKLTIASKPPTVVMMTGLQGAGKTTHAAKLAGLYKKQGKRPLLVACDVYRPAAVKQLQVVGAQLDIPVFAIEGERDAVKIAREGVEHAIKHGNDRQTAHRRGHDARARGDKGGGKSHRNTSRCRCHARSGCGQCCTVL